MQTARRRRTTWAIGASVIAHLVVLVGALLQRPSLPPLEAGPSGPPEPIIPILLLPRAPPAPTASGAPQPSELRLHRRPVRGPEGPLPLAPLVAAPQPVQAPEAAAPTTAAPSRPAGGPAGPAGPDLRLGLRHGAAGCANAAAVGMSRAEREACDEQFASRTASAPFLPAAIGPRVRAYYDAVAEAKKPDPPLVPLRARSGMSMFEGDPIVTNGHGPSIGCKIPKPKLPHALMLGPCYIEPPKGSLTPEVDLTPP